MRFMAVVVASGLLFGQSGATKGKVERIKVHGKSLEGNLEGDSPDRDVVIYLPPGYETNPSQRYPVVYLLHGYSATEQIWNGVGMGPAVPGTNVPRVMDDLIVGAKAKPMIVVMPNAYTVYGGSMYSSSVTTGDWEAYLADDLVGYVDSHYRTIPDRMSRGLAGHSMGGYGAIRIGMKRPDVFANLYIMSACCLINDPLPADPGFAQVGFALAAAFSPNPKNPPRYFDEPVKKGKEQPLVIAKWHAASPLAMIDQYVTNLKKYHAIAGEVGLQDVLADQNKQLDQVMTEFGIAHTFETYQGDHTNRVPQRIESRVLPFFLDHLAFVEGRQ